MKLPKRGEDLVAEWRKDGESFSATARRFGVAESSVRRRVHKALGQEPREYNRLSMTGEQLYMEWLLVGGDRDSINRLATHFGFKKDSIRSAIRRFLDSQE